MTHGFSHGLPLKKKYGQHFLRDHSVTQKMLAAVELTAKTSIFEIGCGDGFLTRAILQKPCERLWIFEIDHHWATLLKNQIKDPRMQMHEQNILDLDFSVFNAHAPWTLLSNLPYQITFPILHILQKNRHLLKEGVIMIQEEVAEKILKTSGRGYGYPSLFFQRFFEWKKLDKVLPGAFYPPPKVDSRLLYFKPRQNIEPIVDEVQFWKFIKACFKQPRRTLRNNLAQTHFDTRSFTHETMELRAQQLGMKDFIDLWHAMQHQTPN